MIYHENDQRHEGAFERGKKTVRETPVLKCYGPADKLEILQGAVGGGQGAVHVQNYQPKALLVKLRQTQREQTLREKRSHWLYLWNDMAPPWVQSEHAVLITRQ